MCYFHKHFCICCLNVKVKRRQQHEREKERGDRVGGVVERERQKGRRSAGAYETFFNLTRPISDRADTVDSQSDTQVPMVDGNMPSGSSTELRTQGKQPFRFNFTLCAFTKLFHVELELIKIRTMKKLILQTLCFWFYVLFCRYSWLVKKKIFFYNIFLI